MVLNFSCLWNEFIEGQETKPVDESSLVLFAVFIVSQLYVGMSLLKCYVSVVNDLRLLPISSLTLIEQDGVLDGRAIVAVQRILELCF